MGDNALSQVNAVTNIQQVSKEDARRAAIQAAEATLRLHGLLELPPEGENDDLRDEILDEVDRCIDRLGLFDLLRKEDDV